jgi:ribosomal protein S18 acetylase RimI-like enzyme
MKRSFLGTRVSIFVLMLLMVLLSVLVQVSSFSALPTTPVVRSTTSLYTKNTHDTSHTTTSSDDNDSSSSSPPPELKFHIRNARYMELGHVVNIILDAFYQPSAFLRPFLYTSELTRLKNNFPHDQKIHAFYVACSIEELESSSISCIDMDSGSTSTTTTTEQIIGFVDVDKRIGTHISEAPRPYLSDLAVHTEFRRKGIAKALIKRCEEQAMDWGEDYLNLRVDQLNDGALKMYEDLEYEKQDHAYFGHGRDTTILLKRVFNLTSMSDTCDCDNASDNASDNDVMGGHTSDNDASAGQSDVPPVQEECMEFVI